MKNLILLLLLLPMLGFSQTATDYLMFEIGTIKVSPDKVALVNSGMAAHNKKYHATGPYGARVYNVVTGTDAGAYKWVMGPGTWSGLDARPSDELHDMDWDSKVDQYTSPGGNQEYIRFDPKLSRFPHDFTVNKLFVRYVDVARGKMEAVKAMFEKAHKVYAEKIPNETYGVYFNEVPSTSGGRDLILVSYFDKYAWMAMDDGFDAKYEEVYGKGSAAAFWNEWNANTLGMESEIWEYNKDLSGLPAEIKAAERQ